MFVKVNRATVIFVKVTPDLTSSPPRVEVCEREAGAPHRRPRAAPVPGDRAGVHPVFPGGEGPAAPPRQPLHLRSPGDRQDGLPQLCPAGDEGAFKIDLTA